MKLGNGLWEHTDFKSRLQPTLIGLGASATASGKLKLEYDYGTTSNNGNVLSQKITAPTVSGTLLLAQTYDYDKLNRLQTANEKVNQESTARWTQTFSFDRWGNRTGLTNTGELPPANQKAVNPATNRLLALTEGYDEAGNQLSDESSHSLNYDAENHQRSFTTGAITYNYSYDGDGRRVKREYNDGTLHTTIFVYNASGQLIAEYDNSTSPPSGGGTSYLITDHLGSTRAVMKSDGSVARHDYLPFGEEIPSNIGGRSGVAGYSTADFTRQKFTQKERDSESGLDYFLARYYSSAQGRFTSPDAPFADQSEDDPQSWNLYVYVRGNPLRFTDPTGMAIGDLPGVLTWHYEEQEIDGQKHKVVVGDYDNEYLKGAGYWNAKTRKWGKYHDWTPGLSSFSRLVFLDLARREKATVTTLAVIGGFNLAPAVIAATTLSGGSITTLGTLATRLAGPAAATGGVLNQLSGTDASIFQKAIQFGASATNSFANNLTALADAVRSFRPDAQVTRIGQIGNSQVFGSLRSGVGIAELDGVTVVVKMVRGTPQVLGPLP